MPPAKWDEKRTSDLFLSMLTVVAPGELTAEQKAQVEALMNEKGHDVSWNGIRYACPPNVALAKAALPSSLPPAL